METSVNQEQITAGARAAAEWWAEQIGHPIHKMIGDDPNDPDRLQGDFAFLAMGIISAQHPVSGGAAEKFVEALSGRIKKMMQRGGFGSLGVDYGPDMELAESADAAGIHYSRFPFKTHMWIRPDHVTAALGYHGVTRIVWSAPGWVRPACGTHQYDDEWNALGPVCSKPIYHEDEHGDWIPDPQRCKECGGSYVDHYGREAKNGERCLYWEPTS